MKLKPTNKINCYYVLDVSLNAYLTDDDPSIYLTYPEDEDHLYKEITEGTYYPVINCNYINGKKIVGYFVEKDREEYLCFYNEEFNTDTEWNPVTQTLKDFISTFNEN